MYFAKILSTSLDSMLIVSDFISDVSSLFFNSSSLKNVFSSGVYPEYNSELSLTYSAKSSSDHPSVSKASPKSHPLGLDSPGGLTILTSALSLSISAIRRAARIPEFFDPPCQSLSGQIKTVLPYKGEKSIVVAAPSPPTIETNG